MRSLPQWDGKTDDSSPPAKVRLRIWMAHDGRCAKCGRKLGPGVAWEADHIIAICNGGRNIESNYQPLCKVPCHSEKTASDVAIKSKIASVQAKHLGLRKPTRGFAANRDGKFKRRMDGTVVLRNSND